MRRLIILPVVIAALLVPAGPAPAGDADEVTHTHMVAYRKRQQGSVVQVLYHVPGGSQFVSLDARREGPRLIVDIAVTPSYNESLGIRCVSIPAGKGIRSVLRAEPRKRVPHVSRAGAVARGEMRAVCR